MNVQKTTRSIPGSTTSPPTTRVFKKRSYRNSSFANSTSRGIRTAQLGLDVTGVNNVSGHLNQGNEETQIKAAVNPSINRGICFDTSTTPNRYYPVLQDSHTLIKLNLDAQSATRLVTSGYVVASRCVKNDKLALYKETPSNRYRATHDLRSTQRKATSAYILSLPYRPFYFPNEDTDDDYHDIIQCCKVGSNSPTDCKKVVSTNSSDTTFVPRIFYIYFETLDFDSASTTNPQKKCFTRTSGVAFSETGVQMKPRFFGKVASVSEFPELQDAQLNWGAGFILTSEGRQHEMNPVLYTLDTFFIKNRCATSPGLVSECPRLEFGKNPGTLNFEGIAQNSLQSKDMLEFEVSGCFNSGSGVKHGKAIRF